MKKTIFYFIFTFCSLFSTKTNAFVAKASVVSDSCSEITLTNGQVLPIKILHLFDNRIIYQDCGDKTAKEHIIFMENIKDLKVKGTPEEVARLKKEMKMTPEERKWVMEQEKKGRRDQKISAVPDPKSKGNANRAGKIETATLLSAIMLGLYVLIALLSLALGNPFSLASNIISFVLCTLTLIGSFVSAVIGYGNTKGNPELRGNGLALGMAISSGVILLLLIFILFLVLLSL